MTAPTTIFKHTFSVAGDEQGRSPNFYGFTPASIIAGDGAEFTPGELAVAITDDSNFVDNALNPIPTTTTGRSNLLVRYDGLGSISGILFLHRFSHVILGNPTFHNQRLYVYNFVTPTFEQIAALGGSAEPRTFSGSAIGPTFTDYQDVGGEIFILHWDFEGVFHTGGGCVNANTRVTLENGKTVTAKQVKFRDKIMTRLYGERVARKVDEKTFHHPAMWDMVRVNVGHGLNYEVTHNHWCPTGLGIEDQKRASDLVPGDQIPDVAGKLWTIPENGIIKIRKHVEVVDLDVRNTNYEVGGGLLVRTMPYG